VPRLVGVLSLCVALVACGKSTEEKYKDGFAPVDRGLVALGDDVAQGLRSANDAGLAAEFAGYARRLGALRERLDALEAPGRLSGDHEALLAAMTATRADLSEIAAAARRADAAAAGAAATGLVRSAARLEETRARLARAVLS
jgi:hypothetical protein